MENQNEGQGRETGLTERWNAAVRGGRAPGHKNMLLLIQLRWIAVAGQVTTIVIAAIVFGVQLPLPYMLEVVACLVAFNVASHLRWSEQQEVTNSELFLSLLVDVISLTTQLYLSGGTNNPFAFLYLLQVILSAVLLRGWATWIIVLATSVCLAGLALFAKPLPLQLDHSRGIFSLYVQGLLLCFALDAALLVFFIRRITNNLRAGDAKLAALRQRAAEEEHIVRMGLLASGAAHELGTPLATLSVILGDWRRMPAVSKNPDLLDDITEMQTQLQRCKSIVSGILLSAGEARGESSVRTTIHTFLDQLTAEWRASRPVASFDYYNRIGEDLPVVFDSALKQMICNVLDNALEASPEWLSFVATREDDMLVMSVADSGPGFAPEILAQFGKPYNSSKGRPGGGLGLFLSVNVARTLGGTVEARNRPQGGASVQMRLPLAALVLQEEPADAE
ncbi:ATP-binding protein [Rugamonas apoptosis]|uniref:histidine kinase n=1 Tax=Rugamonas apoptosis TaxID=2758570 RepID=A0A7W2INH1_9BURK|nr:ATP-binding protein [Rugamonas apoptosis]MBA5690601.1 HAMP domain-containing histidine kinase [Rugamonas apoptosis]